MSQQATEFLRPFRDQYENVNYTVIDRNAFVQELQFLVEDAKLFNRRIYHPSVFYLQSTYYACYCFITTCFFFNHYHNNYNAVLHFLYRLLANTKALDFSFYLTNHYTFLIR